MAINEDCLALGVVAMPAAQGNAVRTEFVWAPMEPIATRPLALRAKNWGLNLFYSHDGNKNVSEVFYHVPQNGIAAHYDYAPFGAVTRTSSATSGDGGMSDSDSFGDASMSGDEVGSHQGGITFPSGFDGPNPEGDGIVYENNGEPATKEVKRLNTNNNCQFDLFAINYMKGLIGQCANDALIGQNCRSFSDAVYEELVRKYNEKK